jgi:hypothetical protein
MAIEKRAPQAQLDVFTRLPRKIVAGHLTIQSLSNRAAGCQPGSSILYRTNRLREQ